MEDQELQKSSRVVKVDSPESWNFYVSQAKSQACPVSLSSSSSLSFPKDIFLNTWNHHSKILLLLRYELLVEGIK